MVLFTVELDFSTVTFGHFKSQSRDINSSERLSSNIKWISLKFWELLKPLPIEEIQNKQVSLIMITICNYARCCFVRIIVACKHRINKDWRVVIYYTNCVVISSINLCMFRC